MNKVKQPSEFQVKIADIIGKAYTECIRGNEECDTSVEIAAEMNVDEIEPCSSKSSEMFTESAGHTSSDDRFCRTTTKRRRCEKGAPTSSCRPTKRQTQNQKILETEKDMVVAVNAMKEELKRTNSFIENIGEHMKQSNDISTNFGNFEAATKLSTGSRRVKHFCWLAKCVDLNFLRSDYPSCCTFTIIRLVLRFKSKFVFHPRLLLLSSNEKQICSYDHHHT